jgi:hypothetical protein
VTRWRLLLVPLLVLAVSCGDDGPREATEADSPEPEPIADAGPQGSGEAATTTTEDPRPDEPGDPADTIAPGGPDEPPCDDPPEPPEGEPVGWADLDGDGRAELWVRTGQGASTLLVGAYAYGASCEPVRITLGSSPFEFPVGGSVTSTSGLSCAAGDRADLLLYSTSSTDGERYEVAERSVRLEGTDLVEVRTRTRTATVDDPDFPRFSTFACGSLVL